MELIFNELSISPLCSNKTEAFERLDKFIATYKEVNTFGFNKIRFDRGYESIDLLGNYTLNDYCNETQHRTKGTLLRGLFKMPFIDDNSEEEKQYIESSFELKKDGKEINPYGLAAAFLYAVPAIGFLSENFWEDYVFDVIVKNAEEKQEKVYCISKSEHIKEQTLIDFIEAKLPIELLETSIKPEDKKSNLRDDHGKDKLEAFSERIRKSKYVKSVINSLPYNPHCKKFIKNIDPKGTIKIVLTHTDKGLGVVIQTTGRNIRETTKIAEMIEKEYNPVTK
jgi:hypothetical protein